MRSTYTLLLFYLFFSTSLLAQNGLVKGIVSDEENNFPLEFVSIGIKGTAGTQSDSLGYYELSVPPRQVNIIEFRYVGKKPTEMIIPKLKKGEVYELNIRLENQDGIVEEVVVTDKRIEEEGMQIEGVKEIAKLPSISGNLESLLPSIFMGVSAGTGGELSSQYSVRGGSYDENLVYVNDFEIYRPQLIRSGQQEGLTFPNLDLTRELSFSSGGFQAKYGDKMASVLDIQYKKPDSLRGSFELSALGASAHLEGSIKKKVDPKQALRILVGARYKTTRYLLGTLDTKGEYTPNFLDIQGDVTYDLSRTWQLEFIGNLSRSEYQFVPVQRSTALGLVNFALELRSSFQGQEVDDFTTYMTGVSLTHLPRSANYYLKFMASRFQSRENERFDIIGDYLLGELNSDLGSEEFGEIVSVLGSGTTHNFARNYLTANVTNVSHKGGWILGEKDDKGSPVLNNRGLYTGHYIRWGAKYQSEVILDQLNEWERLDSAGYSLDFSDDQVLVKEVLKTSINLNSNRFNAYVQDSYSVKRDSSFNLTATVGVRASYWDLNEEFTVTPRGQLLLEPLGWDRNFTFSLSSGLYYQPPFYRELRNLEGGINEDVQSQKSAHFVLGATYDFNWGKNYPKKFRFIGELFYKKLWDLVLYDINNVRLRYYGDNNASGYVAGLDFRLNGEFVPGAESWINVSLMRARESITDLQHLKRELGVEDAIEVNSVPRPTDQFMVMSVFFQDYLPKHENFKTHLNLTVGTGLPFGIPDNNTVYRNTYRYNAYHRIDIGFSAQLWDKAWKAKRPKNPFRAFEDVWISLEIFNLMQVANSSSNTWIKTIYNTQYAIPNYLTSRRINLRMKVEF